MYVFWMHIAHYWEYFIMPDHKFIASCKVEYSGNVILLYTELSTFLFMFCFVVKSTMFGWICNVLLMEFHFGMNQSSCLSFCQGKLCWCFSWFLVQHAVYLCHLLINFEIHFNWIQADRDCSDWDVLFFFLLYLICLLICS